jgi:hypothetical protein
MMVEHKRGMKRKAKVTRRSRPPFTGRLVAIGGQCRKVGKTALVVDLIKTFPKYRWTAIKITPYVESGCPVKGARCSCGPGQHTFAIRHERIRSGKADTSRFLAAGAENAIWVHTKSGRLEEALPSLASAIGDVENVIVESNAILKYWKPDLFLLLLDPANTEFKSSARQVQQLADAFVFRSPYVRDAHRKGSLIPKSGRPKFLQPLGAALSADMQKFVRQRFLKIGHPTTRQSGRIFS